jgi:hypothetical protein
MTSFNYRSSIENGWDPAWFGITGQRRFTSTLSNRIREFQRAEGLSIDGLCGRKTAEIIRKKQSGNFIYMHTRAVPIDSEVVSWCDDGGLKAEKGSYREKTKKRNPIIFVNHWDVCLSSESCHKVLSSRNLSCHFLIDNDGCIFQTMNTNHVAWHAGGRRWNDRSIGVEISNAYYMKWQKSYVDRGFGERPIIRNAKVHGNMMEDHLGFYPVQLEALRKLWDVIYGFYDIPLQTPTDSEGNEITGVYAPAVNLEYSGFIHHFHLTRSKIDCGGLDLTSLISK